MFGDEDAGIGIRRQRFEGGMTEVLEPCAQFRRQIVRDVPGQSHRYPYYPKRPLKQPMGRTGGRGNGGCLSV